MNRLTRLVAFLFFGSGVCALIYEIAWFREFRLVFGASTLANAAVLAVFIGGLGAGGFVIGKRADRVERPLVLYAQLEAGAAVLAALSPLLLWIMRKAYILAGGTPVLGSFGATIVRLVLTVIVLLGPTFLMGGTLPVAARAVETDDDSARRRVGLLYGANALGAVVGCVLANFLMLELLGTRATLWTTSAFNLLIAGVARAVAPRATTVAPATVKPSEARLAEDTPTAGSIVQPVSAAMTAEPVSAATAAMTAEPVSAATAANTAEPASAAIPESGAAAETSAAAMSGAAEPASGVRDAVAFAARAPDEASEDAQHGRDRAVDGTVASVPATPAAKKAVLTGSATATQRSIAVPKVDRASARVAGREFPTWYVPFASAAVGFVFFLMELVWYRMLGPLLGGTVFTFGIILAVALLGIGIGGTLYALFGSEKPASLNAFAVTCLLEAILLAVPYALGDRIATFALLLRSLGALYFAGLVAGWVLVTLVVVLPPAIVAGVQFPLLIALMGQGKKEVGAQTGWVYAANTGGSIAGALAGGFGLLPLLSVLGCWKFAAGLLALVGLGAAAETLKRWSDAPFRAMWTVLGAIAVFMLLRAEGPTAVWRHSPIGVGRVPHETTASINNFRDWVHSERRGMKWEADGIESTVALDGRHGFAFIVNGKSDGHSVVDAPTQVMGGLVGAVLQPIKRALVIGLGTGSTAGWLGALPEMERVDVAELEPAILHVAEVASIANHHVLNNPVVHINIGDAREQLLTSRSRYDVIFSEPSNPYRAGVASLFTREYYEACADRLTEDGLFLQWVQAYDIDKRTLRAVYATLGSVFPEIETWELAINDLLLVASKKPLRHDIAAIRARVAREPMRSALLGPWRAIDAEGFFSHYVGNADFGRFIANANSDSISTDDRNHIEFGFARTANAVRGSEAEELRLLARGNGQHRPPGIDKGLDWERVDDGWLTFQASSNTQVSPNSQMNEGQRRRAAAIGQFVQGLPQQALGHWSAQKREPTDPTEIAVIAQSLAESADEAAVKFIDRLRPLKPAEAAAILGRLRLRQDKFPESAAAVEAAFIAYRTEPWSWPFIMGLAIDSAKELTAKSNETMGLMREALSKPFALNMFDDSRRATVLALDMVQKLDSGCIEILRPFEPYVPWREELLSWRTRCYSLAHHPEQQRAQKELDEFNRNVPMPFGKGLDFVRAGP
jgi:spermidine synthase